MMYEEQEERATHRQLGLLRSKGVSEGELANLTKRRASDLIDKLLATEGSGGKQPQPKTQTLQGLLEAADEIMKHVGDTAVYSKLSEAGKVEVLKALVDAYARMRNTMEISEGRSRHR